MNERPIRWTLLFENAMKRELAEPEFGADNKVLNLGSGNAPIHGAVNLDRPEWEAPILPFDKNSVGAIHAYHFFEHLDTDCLYAMLMEIDRVLLPGGVVNYCVPYAMAPIAFMDVTHRTYWTEETMRTLLEARGYPSAADVGLKIHTQAIIGLTSQNLAVVGQLIKN